MSSAAASRGPSSAAAKAQASTHRKAREIVVFIVNLSVWKRSFGKTRQLQLLFSVEMSARTSTPCTTLAVALSRLAPEAVASTSYSTVPQFELPAEEPAAVGSTI